MKIGLVYAMGAEIRSIIDEYNLTDPEYHMGMPFYRVSDNIIAVAGGVGKVNTAAATTLMCELYNVDVIVNSGLAGGFEDYPVGTLVLVDRCVQHDVDTSVVGDEPGFVSTVNIKDFYTDMTDFVADVFRKNNIPFVIGAAASGDWFASAGERAEWIKRTFDPLVADIEAAAIAQVCYKAGVKFISVKGVSDRICSDDQHDEYYGSLDNITDEISKAVKILVEALAKE